MKIMIITIMCILLICFVSGDETEEKVKPETAKTTSSYRSIFLSNEGQSCSDISDSRNIERINVEFCSVNALEPDISTTLSFWGWENGKGNVDKSLSIYANNIDNDDEELFLFEILISSNSNDENEVQWYHRDFKLNDFLTNSQSLNVNQLILYYSVHSISKRDHINLRDVWIRPTKTYAAIHPPRYCNNFLNVTSSIISFFSMIMMPFFLVICGKILFPKRCCLQIELKRAFRIFLTAAYVYLLCYQIKIYTDGYPNVRCKDDDYFITIIIWIVVGIVLELLYRLICWWFYVPPVIEEDEDISNHDERMSPLTLTHSQQCHSTIIETATKNSLEKKFINRQVYQPEGNECSLCMESYSIERPGVVTECGHVWCSHCIGDICKMRLPNNLGTCPICRSRVLLTNLILYNEQTETDQDKDEEEGGGGGGANIESLFGYAVPAKEATL